MVKMNFVGVVTSTEHRVIVDDHDREDGVYQVNLDGESFEVDSRTMPSEIISLMIKNRSYDVDIDDKDQSNDPLDGRLGVRVRGRVVRLEMLEERRKKMKDATQSQFSHSGLARITSPMPGKVLRFLVAVGDTVSMGQGVAVIEAMKMENEIKSPKSGTVKSINANPGVPVDGGALLMVIE